jgi:hypothetical protein
MIVHDKPGKGDGIPVVLFMQPYVRLTGSHAFVFRRSRA